MKGWRLGLGIDGSVRIACGLNCVLLMPDGSMSVRHPDGYLSAAANPSSRGNTLPPSAKPSLALNGKSRRNLIKRNT